MSSIRPLQDWIGDSDFERLFLRAQKEVEFA